MGTAGLQLFQRNVREGWVHQATSKRFRSMCRLRPLNGDRDVAQHGAQHNSERAHGCQRAASGSPDLGPKALATYMGLILHKPVAEGRSRWGAAWMW